MVDVPSHGEVGEPGGAHTHRWCVSGQSIRCEVCGRVIHIGITVKNEREAYEDEQRGIAESQMAAEAEEAAARAQAEYDGLDAAADMDAIDF